MSSKYAGSTTTIRPAVGRSQRRSGLLGLGAVLAGVTAVGAAVAIFLAPAEAPGTSSTVALPAMDASMGFWDFVTVPERPEAALPPMPASMGHWDFTLPAEPTRPAAAHTGR